MQSRKSRPRRPSFLGMQGKFIVTSGLPRLLVIVLLFASGLANALIQNYEYFGYPGGAWRPTKEQSCVGPDIRGNWEYFGRRNWHWMPTSDMPYGYCAIDLYYDRPDGSSTYSHSGTGGFVSRREALTCPADSTAVTGGCRCNFPAFAEDDTHTFCKPTSPPEPPNMCQRPLDGASTATPILPATGRNTVPKPTGPTPDPEPCPSRASTAAIGRAIPLGLAIHSGKSGRITSIPSWSPHPVRAP